MIPFLISLLWLLLYAGLAYLTLLLLFYFFEQIFGWAVPPRPRQIIFAVMGILFTIWFLTSLVGNKPIPPPWGWNNTQSLR